MNKITTSLILGFIALIFLSSCGKNDVQSTSRSIQFDNLKIGDKMAYSYLTGNQYIEGGGNTDVVYTEDTLILEVMDIIDDQYLIQEQITSGSATLISDVPIQLLWDIREDSVIINSVDPEITKGSYLLFDRFRFSLKEITETEVKFDGWKTTQPSSYNDVGYFIEDGELHGISYPHLNVIFDSSEVIYDGDSKGHIFSKDAGFVRTSSTSAMISRMRGWDRIN